MRFLVSTHVTTERAGTAIPRESLGSANLVLMSPQTNRDSYEKDGLYYWNRLI